MKNLFIILCACPLLMTARETKTFGEQQAISFIANDGQVTDQHHNPRNDIDYKLNATGMDVFIGGGGIHYQWIRVLNRDLGGLKDDRAGENNKVEIYRLDVSLIGANKSPKVIAEGKQGYYERYYLAHTGEEGVQAFSYNKVTYKDIYPNIDWVLYTKDNQLKYEFVVWPGGKVSDIRMKYEGATGLQIKDGALIAVTPFGSVTEQRPYSYEKGSNKEIRSHYTLEDNMLGFSTSSYTGTLVIDPYLAWATYYGSNSRGVVSATDITGNAYLFGETTGTTNIATSGTHQQILGGNSDAFLVKFTAAGQRLWGTYYGGTGDENASSMRYDAITDAIYITGFTTSNTGISTPGSHQPVYGGSTNDVYLAKFNSAGLRMWATYYGGTGGEIGADIAIDKNSNIYLTGMTNSSSSMSTPGSHQPAYAGGGVANYGDGFIVKFDNNGNRLWGTYYGGTDDDACAGIITDLQGNIYISGGTNSPTAIATPGSHQTIYGGGTALGSNRDGFLAKFNSNGMRLWGTYYGGSDNDACWWRPAMDHQGNIYLAGITSSTSAIATPGGWQTINGGGVNDAFLVKFSNAGTRLWGTYYGGSGDDVLVNVVFDHARNLYLGGFTTSATGVATPGSHQPVYGGGQDALLVKFNSNGQRLWASYFGGALIEQGYVISSDTSGNIYMAGGSASSTNIATPGAHQTNLIGTNNAFLAKFQSEDTLVYIKPEFADSLLCPGDTIHVPYGITHAFRSNNTFILQLSNAAGNFTSPVNLVTFSGSLAGTLAGIVPHGTAGSNGYRIRIVATGPADTSLVRNIIIKAGPAKPNATSNTPVCVGNSINLSGASITAGVSYSWTGPGSYSSTVQNPVRNNATLAMAGNYILKTTLNGCTSEADTAAVVVNANPPAPVAGSNSPICAGTALNLTATPVSGTYSWNGPGSFSSGLQNPTINPAAASAAGTYTVNVTNANGCVSANGTVNVVINTSTAPTVGLFPNPNDSVCPGALVTFVAVPNNGGTPSYRWFKNTLLIAGATAPTYQTSTISTGDFYSVEMTSTQPCAVPATVNSSNVIMTVVPPVVPSVTITASPGLNVGPWRMITFTATPVNGGPSPTYQWLRNGQPVIGAISNTWGAANLSDNDVISVVLISSEVCAIPPTDTSNVLTVHINMGIEDEDNNTPKLQLYPNPNKGEFIIRGNINSKEVLLEVFNSIGQMVHSERIAQENKELDHGLQLEVASGVYMLRVSTDSGVEVMMFRVE